jgi:transcriptional antiterminator RfaH
MTRATQRHWYLAQTHAHSENKAAANLIRQGYSIYIPRYLKRRSHARRVESVPAPLFPCYLFVAFNVVTERWHSIQSTWGVSRLIRHGDAPALVPETVILNLREREDENGFVRLNPRPNLASGDEIRVVGGVFDTCLGLFEGMAERDRVAVLLELLGRKVRVLLDVDSVVAT